MEKLNKIVITGVECHHSSEGTDEVYITYQADAGIELRNPFGFNTSYHMNNHEGNKYISLEIFIDFDYEALVSLWDNDSRAFNTFFSDYLQSHDFRAIDRDTGKHHVRLKNLNGADYTIYYKFLKINGQTQHH